MPRTTIKVKYVNQPAKGKKYGSIKSYDGDYYRFRGETSSPRPASSPGETKEKTVVEQVKPYELATLASRIYPERCISAPKEAIAAAERLLQEATVAIERAHQEEGRKDWKRHQAEMGWVNWLEGVKEITGQKRRHRAEERFLKFIEHEYPSISEQELDVCRREGFPFYDFAEFKDVFTEWTREPKRKKGKQGRKISEHDGRLRTDLVGLVPRKPQKRV